MSQKRRREEEQPSLSFTKKAKKMGDDESVSLIESAAAPSPASSSSSSSGSVPAVAPNHPLTEEQQLRDLFFQQQTNPIFEAASTGKFAIVEKYLREGGDPDAKASNGNPIIMFAAETGQFEICRLLLSGIPPKVRLNNLDGIATLGFGFKSQNIDIIKLIFDHLPEEGAVQEDASIHRDFFDFFKKALDLIYLHKVSPPFNFLRDILAFAWKKKYLDVVCKLLDAPPTLRITQKGTPEDKTPKTSVTIPELLNPHILQMDGLDPHRLGRLIYTAGSLVTEMNEEQAVIVEYAVEHGLLPKEFTGRLFFCACHNGFFSCVTAFLKKIELPLSAKSSWTNTIKEGVQLAMENEHFHIVAALSSFLKNPSLVGILTSPLAMMKYSDYIKYLSQQTAITPHKSLENKKPKPTQGKKKKGAEQAATQSEPKPSPSAEMRILMTFLYADLVPIVCAYADMPITIPVVLFGLKKDIGLSLCEVVVDRGGLRPHIKENKSEAPLSPNSSEALASQGFLSSPRQDPSLSSPSSSFSTAVSCSLGGRRK